MIFASASSFKEGNLFLFNELISFSIDLIKKTIASIFGLFVLLINFKFSISKSSKSIGILISGLFGFSPKTDKYLAFMEFIIFDVSINSDSARENLASDIETSVSVTSPISNCSFVSSNCLFNTSTFFFLTFILEISVAKSA